MQAKGREAEQDLECQPGHGRFRSPEVDEGCGASIGLLRPAARGPTLLAGVALGARRMRECTRKARLRSRRRAQRRPARHRRAPAGRRCPGPALCGRAPSTPFRAGTRIRRSRPGAPFCAAARRCNRSAPGRRSALRAGSVAGSDSAAVRRFFEALFTPYQVVNPDGSTRGHHHRLLRTADPGQPLSRSATYRYPVYGVPDDLLVVDLVRAVPGAQAHAPARPARGAPRGPLLPARRHRGRQGRRCRAASCCGPTTRSSCSSCRSRVREGCVLDTGETVRLSYADQNGHPYRSVGRSAGGAGRADAGPGLACRASRRGLRATPSGSRQLLNQNASYVFFRETAATEDGPTGALGVPLTAGRSLAVDPRAIPLGAPVFVSTTWPNSDTPLRRLMLAQDTGGAIKGAVRADFYWGSGAEAGAAGRADAPERAACGCCCPTASRCLMTRLSLRR